MPKVTDVTLKINDSNLPKVDTQLPTTVTGSITVTFPNSLYEEWNDSKTVKRELKWLRSNHLWKSVRRNKLGKVKFYNNARNTKI